MNMQNSPKHKRRILRIETIHWYVLFSALGYVTFHTLVEPSERHWTAFFSESFLAIMTTLLVYVAIQVLIVLRGHTEDVKKVSQNNAENITELASVTNSIKTLPPQFKGLFDEYIQKISERQTEVYGMQKNLLNITEQIAAYSLLYEKMKKLEQNRDFQGRFLKVIEKYSGNWIEIFEPLLVGDKEIERHYWFSLFNMYMREEVQDIRERSLATNYKTYLDLLTTLVEETIKADYFVNKKLYFCSLTNLLPSGWYNWVNPKTNKFDKFPKLQEYRTTVEGIIASIKQDKKPISWERIILTAAENDDKRVGLLKVEVLEKEKEFTYIKNPNGNGDPQFKAGELRASKDDLLSSEIDKLPEDDDELSVHFITANKATPSKYHSHSMNLLRKFVEELHTSEDKALYVALSDREIKIFFIRIDTQQMLSL